MPTQYPVPLTLRFVIGAVDVTLPAYLWGQVAGRYFYERPFGSSYAHLFRQRLEEASDALQVAFELSADAIELLRDVTVEAMRSGRLVTFYPNAADTGTSWEVDWATAVSFTRVREARERTGFFIRGLPGVIESVEESDILTSLQDETTMTEGLQDEDLGLTPLESET